MKVLHTNLRGALLYLRDALQAAIDIGDQSTAGQIRVMVARCEALIAIAEEP